MTFTRHFVLTLFAALLALSPAAQACGGGGSGSYRKPPRPGQHQHQHSQLAPTSEQGSTTPESAPK